MRSIRYLTGLAALSVVALAAAACGSSTSSSSSTTTAPTSSTSPTVTTATPPTSPNSSSDTGTISPPASSATSTATSAPTSGSASACTTSQLAASLGQDGGGAAGSFYYWLVLTNHSSTTCTVYGYPGVSYVGHGNGTTVGAPATRSAVSPVALITLTPGRAAQAQLREVDPGVYDNCQLTAVDGLRVYPPNQTASLYLAQPGQTCANTADNVLGIGPMQPIS